MPPVAASPSSSASTSTVTAPVATDPVPPIDYKAIQTSAVIEHLLKTYRPRLSTTAYSPETGFVGNIETYKIKELHSLGVTLLRKPYGVDLIYNGKSFIVSSWRLPHEPLPSSDPEPVEVSQSLEKTESFTDKF